MMIAHTKNFCICQLNYGGRTFYFLNEYKKGKPTNNAGEKAGKYYTSENDAVKRLYERQASYNRSLKNFSFYQFQDRVRSLAVRWQTNMKPEHSWRWCIDWAERFTRMAEKYNLIDEFIENGIISGNLKGE